MNKPQEKLTFVYNADAGLGNALLDYGTKIFAPSKQSCSLCACSYGPFGQKKQWKQFIQSLPYRVTFLHRDEYEAEYKKAPSGYPALMYFDAKKPTQLLGEQEFHSVKSLDELQSVTLHALKKVS